MGGAYRQAELGCKDVSGVALAKSHLRQGMAVSRLSDLCLGFDEHTAHMDVQLEPLLSYGGIQHGVLGLKQASQPMNHAPLEQDKVARESSEDEFLYRPPPGLNIVNCSSRDSPLSHLIVHSSLLVYFFRLVCV